MEHAVSTAAAVFPTPCRNYYDPYQQQSMAPSTKTYTIRNENNRKPKKIDSLNLIRNNPPDFSSNPPVPAVPHPIRQPTCVAVKEKVPEQRHAPIATQAVNEKPVPKPNIKQVPAPLKPALKPTPKPVTKPAPVLLTQTQPPHSVHPSHPPRPPHSRREYRRELPLPPRDELSAEYSPTDPGILDRELPPNPPHRPNPRVVPPQTGETPHRPTPRVVHPRTSETPPRDKRVDTVKEDLESASLFTFSCFRPRQKGREKNASSFKVIDSRLSEYETPPVPVPAKARQPQMTSCGVPIAKYKFLYPKVPDNIPGRAGRNTIPTEKQPKSKLPPQQRQQQHEEHQDRQQRQYQRREQQQREQQQKREEQREQPQNQHRPHTTPTPPPPPPPPPPRRVVKRLSSHLSHHPAVKTLMYQYPTVEMFEKRTGFDSYFESPFVGYSHSYWTALHRPPSPFKKQKPLKVKFDTPTNPTATVETYGSKSDLGDGLHLRDSYSYPYAPEDYGKRFDFGFDPSSMGPEQKYRVTKPQSGESLVLLGTSDGRNTWISCKSA